jgi:small subunit ribosomal protein S27e
MTKRRQNRSSFLKINCEKCKNEQVVFNKAASKVECLVCGEELAKSTGGIAEIKGKIIQKLD